jgi:hypothetical protein
MKKRKNLRNIALIISVVVLTASIGMKHIQESRVSALTGPEPSINDVELEATSINEFEPTQHEAVDVADESTNEVLDDEPGEMANPELDNMSEFDGNGIDVAEQEDIEQEVASPEHEKNMNANSDAENNDDQTSKKKTCNHLWRREYEPETETEEGYLIDSCLYCGEWYVYEVIPPYCE